MLISITQSNISLPNALNFWLFNIKLIIKFDISEKVICSALYCNSSCSPILVAVSIGIIIPLCVRHSDSSLFISDATGTGILFFDFYRILMTLMGRQEDPVLWLFENVVHMNKETKETICRFLEVIASLCAVFLYHDANLKSQIICCHCFDWILLEKLIMTSFTSL